jgi:hypothetical protein
MKHIGYLYIRKVDSIRYDIYQNNNYIFTMIKNKTYKINLPQKFLSLDDKIDLTLYNSENYKEYDKESKNHQVILK